MTSADFFSRLKQLAATVDRQVNSSKAEFERTDRQFCYPVVMKKINDVQQETKDSLKELHAQSARLRDDRVSLDEIISLGTKFLESQNAKVSEIEQHMTQYGYRTYNEAQEKQNGSVVEKQEVESTGEDVRTENKLCTTPQVSKAALCLNRTPQPEDFGVSQSTIKLLENLEKQHHTATKTQPSSTGTNSQTGILNTQPLSRVAVKNPQTSKVISVNEDDRKTSCATEDASVPPVFRHSGIIMTPSLTQDLGINLDTTCNHAALASPLVSSIQFDLTETKEPAQPANPALRLAFDEQGCPSPAMPVTPELRTEGIHEILTGKKHHSVAEKKTAEVLKRPVHVGLFKSSESLRKNTPVSKTVTASGSDIDLPEEPGLTYSLEELSEMTGVFKINPLQPPPLMSGIQSAANKENVTPPEPELLSDRFTRLRNETKVTRTPEEKSVAMDFELPPTPKLLGTYSFLKK